MSSSSIPSFYSYTTNRGVYYGPGCLKTALAKLVSSLGATRALVVTGKSLRTKANTQTDIVERVENVLKELGVYGDTFSSIGEHSPIASIDAGINALGRANADFIVGVGGGSPIDASKVMSYLLNERNGKKEAAFIKQIAIPTTLSVAETTNFGGYTNAEGEKVGVFAKELAPFGIIYDAELTLATPERLWLSTGMRALDHAVENLYRPGTPYPIKTMCYQAIADLFKYLPESKANPNDVSVRQRLQVASWMSLWPIDLDSFTPIGLSHSLGHRLGATYGIPHGMTSCLTLGPVVVLQASIAKPEDKEALAHALSYLHIPSSISVENDVRTLGAEIVKLVFSLGLRTNLSAYNVPKSDFPKIASHAYSNSSSGGKDDKVVNDVIKVLEGIYA